jgi:cell volume regulation protein A
MFLALGLLVNPSELVVIAPLAVAISLFMIFIARPLTVFLCLWPFKKILKKGKLFVSWVGLRGAVPIIFATYPYVEGVPFAKTIFNIVFFITILSLILQGTTVPLFAKIFGVLDADYKHKDFAVYVPEDIAITSEVKVTPALLKHGSTIRQLGLEDNALPVMIKRGGKYMIARGSTGLQEGDKILLIAQKEDDLNALCANLNIDNCEVYRDD